MQEGANSATPGAPPSTASAPDRAPRGPASATEQAPTPLLADILGGVLQGLMCDLAAFVYAIFVFAHAPAADLPVGVAALLIGTFVLNLVVGLGSHFQPVILGPQDTVAVLLLVMVSAVSASVGAHSPGAVLPTVLVLILISSVALGASYLLLGSLRLGQLVRYLPYPVIGGFLVGAGWFLFVGGFVITTPSILGNFRFTSLVAIQIGAAFAVAIVVPLAQKFIPHPLTLIASLLIIVGIFWMIVAGFGVSVAQARQSGWLLDALPTGNLLQIHWIGALRGADWGAVLGQSGNILTLVVINTVSALLCIASLEVAYSKRADVDRELRVRGVANILTGLAGGVGGFDYVIFGVIAHRGGARTRLVPLVAAAVTLAILLGGSVFLDLIPRFVLAGMMFLFGIGLLAEWLIGMWSSLPRLEYAIVVVIALVTIVLGFFQGLVVGILAAVVLFAVSYSRTGAIKHEIPGTAYHSNVDRPLDAQRLLHERAAAVHIYELQGYIFFGTAYSILQRVRERMDSQEPLPLRYAVLDFRHVTGLDSSAAYSFSSLQQQAHDQGVLLLYTSLTTRMVHSLKLDSEDTTPEQASSAAVLFPDIDHALEWCEDLLLADADDEAVRSLARRLAEEMRGTFTPDDIQTRLLAHLTQSTLAQGDYLVRQGDTVDEIYLVSTGRVAVELELPTGKQLRLRVMNAGTLVGELAFYRNAPRTASVIAVEPTTCYRVSWDALTALEAHDAPMVAAFHAYVARVLSERLTTMNDTVAALLR